VFSGGRSGPAVEVLAISELYKRKGRTAEKMVVFPASGAPVRATLRPFPALRSVRLASARSQQGSSKLTGCVLLKNRNVAMPRMTASSVSCW
jgi:hypothetical protein